MILTNLEEKKIVIQILAKFSNEYSPSLFVKLDQYNLQEYKIEGRK